MPLSESRKCQMTRVGRLRSGSSRSSFGATCAFLGLIFASLVSAQEDVQVVRFSPNTPAHANSNIEIEFDRRMVPFGQRLVSSDAAPATIHPALKCAWRWVGDRTLLCETSPGAPLRLATEYTITVHPGLKSEDGSVLAQEVEHQFRTSVVDLRNVKIEEFKRPGLPIFEVRFNQPVRREDVKAHVFLKLSGTADEATDADRLSMDARPKYRSKVAVFSDGAWVKYPFYDAFQYERGNTESWYHYELKEGFDYSNIALERWLVKPINKLPEGVKFDLVAERVPSVFGPEVRHSVQVRSGFRTLGRFEFLGVECTNPNGDYIKVAFGRDQTNEPPSESGMCRSDASVYFRFTAPALPSEIAQKLQITATDGREVELRDGAETGDLDQDTNWLDDYGPRFGTVRVPWVWQPNTKYTLTDGTSDRNGTADNPVTIRDIYGRELRAGVHQSFQTSHLAPYVSLGDRWERNAVLELETDSDVPVHSTNVWEIPLHYRLLGKDGTLTTGVRNLRPPALEDMRQVSPLGVREILGSKSGAFFVRASIDHDEDPKLFVQVTPYSVHAKIGFFDSVVWVTDLKTGKTVRNAHVEFVTGNLKTLQLKSSGIESRTNRFGVASLPGFRVLGQHEIFPRTRREEASVVKVVGRKGLALLPIDWSFRAGLWHQYPTGSVAYPGYAYLNSWGTSSQGVYRRGDTVQFKLYLRGQDNFRHVAPPSGAYELRVKGPLKSTVYETEFELDAFGTFHGEFPVPKNAAMGWYRFIVRPSPDVTKRATIRFRGYGNRPKWTPMRVFVADFTPAPFNVSTELEHERYGYDSVVRSRTSVRFHSGGALAGGEGQVSIRLQPQDFKSSKAKDLPFRFSTRRGFRERELVSVRAVTDASGEITSEVRLDDAEPAYARLWATGAVADERGRDVYSKSPYAEYFGVDRYVGIKIDSWIFKAQRESEIKALVVDRSGAPVEDVNVKVTIERRVTNTARVKSFDRVYRRDDRTTWEEVHSCQGKATKTSFVCKYTPGEAGRLRVSATCVSETLRCSSVSETRTVTGPGAVVWENRSGHRMTLALNSDEFQAGETAQVLVQNPFPKARALVSVERYGILDHWTTTLENSAEVIEIPIKPEYRPGAYVSVVANAPRVAGSAKIPIEQIGAVDLGKPEFRWGTVEIPVEADRQRIAVEVTTDRTTYKPRDQVKALLAAKPSAGAKWREPVQFAVTVLDESVLDLVRGGTDYFDPYKGFAKLHEFGVGNYHLLKQLVARQHMKPKKGVSPGGDGGGAIDLRSISRFVSYWNPSIIADQRGKASFEFTLPDNVTGWRVLALASTPTDRFGLGQGSFKARTLTEIRPAMPNLVNAEDRFDAGFVVVNRVEADRVLDVEVVATGAVKGDRVVAQEEIQLASGERATFYTPIQVDKLPDVPSGNSSGEIRFEVRAGDQLDSDGLLHVLPVRQVHRKEYVSTFGSIESGSAQETFALPAKVVDSSTHIRISASPTVVGNLSRVFQYMRHYPYRCGEQSMSRVLFAAHYEVFKARLDDQLKWPERLGLIEDFLFGLSRYQAPGGGFAYWVPQNRRVSPFLSAYIALGLAVLKDLGHPIPEDAERRLNEYLMEMLRKDVAPHRYSEEMTIASRALALHALSRSGSDELTVDLLERYMQSMKHANVFDLANFLSAALRTPGADSHVEKAWALLLNRSSRTEETLHFEEAMDPVSGVAGASRLRSHCAVLSALAHAYQDRRAFASSRDVEGLVRWVRKSGGFERRSTWELAFCLLALSDYTGTQEASHPNARFAASMEFDNSAEHSLGEKEFTAFSDSPLVATRMVPIDQQGKSGRLKFVADGSGRIHYGAQLSYAPIRSHGKSITSGIGIVREYSVKNKDGWKVLDSESTIAKGDKVRVDLYVNIPATRRFVVVDDPVPAGLEPVNEGLATANVAYDPVDYEYSDPRSHYHSAPFWNGFRPEGVGFYHREIGHSNVIFYSERLSARRYRLTWFGQAVASGTFKAPRARAEEMYSPEIFGESSLFQLIVGN